MLPLMVRTHPELRSQMRLHLVEPVRFGSESPILSMQKLGLGIILTPAFYRLARAIYECKALGRLLFPVIDYIRAYNYMREYREADRAK